MALVAVAALTWSTAGVLTRLIEAGIWTELLYRAGFAAVGLALLIAWQERGGFLRSFRALRRPGLAVAACFAVASTCFVLALDRSSVAHVLFIQAAAPFVAAALARVALGERVGRVTAAAMAAALVGIAVMLVGSLDAGDAVGDALAVVMTLAFSCAIVITRARPGISMTPATCLAMVLATAGVLLIGRAEPASVTPGDLGLLAIFGAIQMGLGLALFVTGAKRIPAAQAALVALLEVVAGPLWVLVAFGEVPDGATLVGGAIILAAVVANTLHATRRPAAVA